MKSSSKKAIGYNIKEMEKAGHPKDQAVAAALHVADEAKGKKPPFAKKKKKMMK